MADLGGTRQERARVTHAAIIDAAAAEFDERGYTGASIDAVAERAGLTTGAVYFHFASKAELAGAVIARQHEVSQEYGAAAAARASSPIEALVWSSQAIATQMVREVVVSAGIRLSTEDATREVDRRQEPYTDWTRIAADLFRQAVDAGEVDPAWDPELLARVAVPAYTGVQKVSDILTERADLYERLRELWTVLLAAVVTDAVRPRIPGLVAIIAPLDDRPGGPSDAGPPTDTHVTAP